MLGRVETRLENCNEREEREANRNECEECDRFLYQRHDERDPDSQYLKSIKIDIHTFDGRHDL